MYWLWLDDGLEKIKHGMMVNTIRQEAIHSVIQYLISDMWVTGNVWGQCVDDWVYLVDWSYGLDDTLE